MAPPAVGPGCPADRRIDLLLPAHAAVQPLDHIVAIVNDEVITRQELAKRYKEVAQSLSRQNTPLPPRDVLEKQLLERMVTELALQQHARSTGVRVDPAQVERALQRIAAQNKLDMPGLAAALEKEGPEPRQHAQHHPQ